MDQGIVTADIVRLRPDQSRICSAWVATYINSTPVRMQVRAITGGVTRPKVTLADFRGLRLAVPTLEEQQRVLTRLGRHASRLDNESMAVAKLRTLKHGLMDDLLTGRVRVSTFKERAA